MYYQWAVYSGMYTSAYQRKDGVDDIETIYLKVYRIKYILRGVLTKFCEKILIITCLIRHFKVPSTSAMHCNVLSMGVVYISHTWCHSHR